MNQNLRLVFSFALLTLLPPVLFAQTGFQPNRVTLSSSLLNFDADGDTTLTGRTDSLSFWIYNGRPDTLFIRDINVSKSVFSPRDTAFIIRTRDSAQVWVRFRTNQNLSFTDVLTIENRGAQGSLALRLRATAKYNYQNAVEARYRATQGLSGNALRTALTTISGAGYTSVGYSNRIPMFSVIDNWRVNGRGSAADRCECAYTGRQIVSYPFNTGTLASAPWNFNTEHTWPQSRFNQDEPMRSDFHHLFPTDVAENSNRSDLPFDSVTSVITTNGGSRRGTNPSGTMVYEPRPNQKGRTARAMMYFVVRYPINYGSYWTEDNVNQEAVFRRWHALFPVDSIDLRRNTAIQSYQNNRNPFIDHPEFVSRLAAFTGSADLPVAPEINTSPMAVAFGAVNVQDSLFWNVIVVNEGNAPLSISNITSNNAAFTISPIAFPRSVAADSFLTVRVRFSPSSVQMISGVLTISSNDVSEPQTLIALSGNGAPLSVIQPVAVPAQAFRLEQNYPNPFNPSTEIRYQVSGTSEVRLDVFDMLGRKVSTLVNERKAAGTYSVNFNAAGLASGGASLASGIYFYRLQAAGFAETKRMMLMK
jgi:endonuclease I